MNDVIVHALKEAHHALTITHNLTAHDMDPKHCFVIDNSKELAAVEKALELVNQS